MCKLFQVLNETSPQHAMNPQYCMDLDVLWLSLCPPVQLRMFYDIQISLKCFMYIGEMYLKFCVIYFSVLNYFIHNNKDSKIR
jgi:hypothetical protein